MPTPRTQWLRIGDYDNISCNKRLLLIKYDKEKFGNIHEVTIGYTEIGEECCDLWNSDGTAMLNKEDYTPFAFAMFPEFDTEWPDGFIH